MATIESNTTSLPETSAATVKDPRLPTTTVAATLSVGVGSVHLAMAPEHVEHWWVFGAFFLAVGLLQVGYAGVLLWRPTWPVAMGGIFVNLAIVLTYVASRTVGLPITPPDEGAEDAGGHGGEGAEASRWAGR